MGREKAVWEVEGSKGGEERGRNIRSSRNGGGGGGGKVDGRDMHKKEETDGRRKKEMTGGRKDGEKEGWIELRRRVKRKK